MNKKNLNPMPSQLSREGVREKIIKSLHDSALGGHSGITGTYQRIKPLFYWPTLKGDIQNWVKECEVFQRSKHENNPYPGLLQLLLIPEQAWSCISMDFIEGLPSSEGKDSILVVEDRLANYSHFIALKHPYTATSIVKLYFDNIYKLHWLLVSIVTDRDKIFTSKFWKELFTLSGGVLGYVLGLSSTKFLENYLRCMCHQKPKKWAQWLTLAEFWFNTNFHIGLKAIPFQALYGYPPHQLSVGPYLQNHHIEVEELMHERVKVLQLLKDNLHQAQQRMKIYADRKRSEREFALGDEVRAKEQCRCSPSAHPVVSLLARPGNLEDYKQIADKFSGFDPWGQASKKGRRNVVFTGQNTTLDVSHTMKGTDTDRAIKSLFEIGGDLINPVKRTPF
ncbi:UNVERIFIED_CONTAM: hypothetical protein Sangu_2898200 [Sesamum angustifolium]|uniref:Integrase zinc-binding domain-containing protein n=1 Tax=Sesamum angustifolium TaxID=2727405 RepID=A0AAW2IMJ9_9LAMI